MPSGRSQKSSTTTRRAGKMEITARKAARQVAEAAYLANLSD